MSDDPDFAIPKEAVPIAAGMFREAFVLTLRKLCAAHGNAYGAWFDEFERETLNALKGAELHGATIEFEATAFDVSIRAVRAVFDQYRAALLQRDRR